MLNIFLGNTINAILSSYNFIKINFHSFLFSIIYIFKPSIIHYISLLNFKPLFLVLFIFISSFQLFSNNSSKLINDSIQKGQKPLRFSVFQENIKSKKDDKEFKNLFSQFNASFNKTDFLKEFETQDYLTKEYLQFFVNNEFENTYYLALKTFQNFKKLNISNINTSLIDLYPAMVSNWNPNYTSKYGAGYWDLSLPVSLKYGLSINSILDERKNINKAYHAYNEYCIHLEKKYNNQEDLSLLALLYGINSISFSAFENNIDDKNPRYFETIYNSLQGEEKQIIAALKAFRIIYFKIYPQIENTILSTDFEAPIIKNDTILVDIFLKYMKLEKREFFDLNPYFSNDSIIKLNKKNEFLYFKNAEKVKLFEKNYQAISDSSKKIIAKRKQELILEELAEEEKKKQIITETEPRTEYVVKFGDNLGLIAQRFKVSVNDLKNWNELQNDMIRPNQKLIIFSEIVITETEEIKEDKVETAVKKEEEYNEDLYIMHVIEEGESLWSISRLYEGVGLYDIIKLNTSITNEDRIEVGQKLRIKLK
jgi:LysM repeat protein